MRATVRNIGFNGILARDMCYGNPCATPPWCDIFYILLVDLKADAEFASQGSCSPLYMKYLFVSTSVSVSAYARARVLGNAVCVCMCVCVLEGIVE